MPAPKSGRLTLWPLVATIFFCVSGGPFGLEPLMQNGVGVGLLLLVATPIFWAAPVALMTAELASAIPAEGGYYVWVRDAVGPFPGFLCAWWSWVYSWLDTALYPTLFFAYLHTLCQGTTGEDVNPWLKWAAGLLVIVPLTYLNIRGIKPTGRVAMILGVSLSLPFVVLCLIGLPHAISHPPTGWAAPGTATTDALSAGLFVVMWNYLGFDSMSTVAGEVDRPTRTFPRALLIATPLIVACYVLPIFVGIASYRDIANWKEGAWTNVAQAIGGPWLAIAITVAGALSAAGMFSADLLSASRIPFVLAEDGLLPPGLARMGRYGTPVVAILVSAFFCTVLSFESFKKLLEVDVVMYSAALILEFVALVVLRRKQPDLARPFRIPGGFCGAIVVAVVPTLVVLLGVLNMLKEQERFGVVASFVGIASGFVAYPVCRNLRRRLYV